MGLLGTSNSALASQMNQNNDKSFKAMNNLLTLQDNHVEEFLLYHGEAFFTSYENKSFYSSDIAKYFQQKVRFGIAPYIGDYGDLHTWVMLQIQHTPKLETEEINVTPLLRFFKDVYLVESGVSLDGEIILNAVVRF